MAINLPNFSLEDLRKKDIAKPNKLFCLILGPRGVGKSTLISTTTLPTLLINFKREEHGLIAARSMNKDIVSLMVDEVDGHKLNDRETYSRIFEVLDWIKNDEQVEKEIKVIAFDSFGVVDRIVQKHPFVAAANSYDKGKVSLQLHMDIVDKLSELKHKFHVLVTMPGTSKIDHDGQIIEMIPDIVGFNAVGSVAGIFAQVLPLRCDSRVRLIDMYALINKTGKTMSGEVKRSPFYPRLTGLVDDEIDKLTNNTGLLPADLSHILRIYKAKELGKLEKLYQQQSTEGE